MAQNEGALTGPLQCFAPIEDGNRLCCTSFPSLLEMAVQSDSALFAAAWLLQHRLTLGCRAGADL